LHVTTGPADRAKVVKEAAMLGFRFFIIEKPLTGSRPDIEELLRTVDDYNLKIVVDFPWLSTPLTRRLKQVINSDEHGKLLGLTMVQEKSRHRAVEAAGHTTAFDIETPHQVSLALHLAGPNAQFRDANCKPLAAEDGIIPAMGGASMLLSHGYTVSNLRSELDSDKRDRHIDLIFEDGWRCIGSYPASGDDNVQRLCWYNPMGNIDPGSYEKFFDDPITSLFLESYRYFFGTGPQPVSTIDLAIATDNLISKAKRACGLEVDPLL
jgi:predicted dehydrogenase